MLFNAWIRILAEARQELRISGEKAAEQAGVCPATWYRWEKGTTYPGPQYLECMAKGLGITADDLALRYCEAMSRHYRDRVGNGSTDEPDVPEEITVGVDGAALEIRGVTSASGVWVNLNDLLDKIARAKAPEPPVRARLQRRRPLTAPLAIRRRKRQSR